ncbi:MAG: Mrp/NBP35 family ATP-binding protein [Actinomycetia bacterium]|nr:Mrp/NBP35 family ATP-binding protein [Actinomycetes bacterium]
MRIIAVMSGKGGVGKSFVATGLAAGIQRRVGHAAVLDADITGASVPHMLGVPRSARVDADGRFVPGLSSDGIRVSSMSLMLPSDEKAVIWRGPLISRAIDQLFKDTDWGDAEYLVVDMPPGTSDAALTVLQTLKPHGVIVVSTPQDMVTKIARRSQDMVRQTGGDVIGLVMNMAYLWCPHCGERIEAFGTNSGGGSDDLPLLATLPLMPEWAALADRGEAAKAASDEFDVLADAVLQHLDTGTMPAGRHV